MTRRGQEREREGEGWVRGRRHERRGRDMKLVMLGKAAECRVKRVILAIVTLQQTAGVSGVAVLRMGIRVRDYRVESYRP